MEQIDDLERWVGMAAARRHPAFRTLLVKLEDKLARFVECHAHPCDSNIETLVRLMRFSTPETAMLRLATAFSHGTLERSLFSFAKLPAHRARVIEPLCGVRGSAALRVFDAKGALACSGLFRLSSSDPSDHELDDLLRLSNLGERLLSFPMATALSV